MNLFLLVALIGSLMGGLAVIKHYNPSYKDDNVVEEYVEEVVKGTTGADVDISPLSKEENK